MKYPVLYQFIKELAPLPESEWEALEEITTIKSIGKSAPLLQIGDQASEVFIIVSGAIRMYYTDEAGKEYNHAFMFEGSIAAGYPSIVKQEPSQFAIESLESTTYLSVPFAQFYSFYDRHPCWDRIGRKVLELNYLDKLYRESILLHGDIKSKYERTLDLYPQLKERIAQYHIASFIGVTASAFNRALKK
jgi:CRP-like cAMP-binding protein